jgi:two-component system phosphate regulon sensor histidine kinase PhoR
MILSGRPWKLVLLAGVLVAMVCGASLWLVWSEKEVPSVPARVIMTMGPVAALATLLFVLIVLRRRRGAFLRVIEAARHLSAGELSDVPSVPGDDDLAALASTLHGVRARLAAQVERIDGQRRMLASLVNQLREGVIVARADGRIALINPSAIRMLNLPVGPDEAEGLAGRPVETCIPQHPLQALLAPVRAGSRADEREPEAEVRLEVQTQPGTVHLLARAADVPLADAERETAATGRAVVLTDITELQRTIELRTDFVANASHELRTPLSTICAAVETLLTMDLSAETPAAMQFLEKIARQGRRLEQMVSDLLDLSRLASPAERFEPEELDVGRLLDDLHERSAAALERKGLHWDAGVEPPEIATVRANPHLLRLVLDNLVDNAVKFTEPGGHVGVHVRVADGQACFEVCDDGCGIPPEDRERVFERFYQVQRSRSGPERGTGLGLSIVRHAVSALRGAVRLESELGRGTRVLVTIPQGTAPS